MFSRDDSVISYVGITISIVDLLPHQEKIGNLFLGKDSGQSPKFIKNSRSGKNT